MDLLEIARDPLVVLKMGILRDLLGFFGIPVRFEWEFESWSLLNQKISRLIRFT